VAHFNNVPESSVRGLEFVRFIGDYRPEHKVHASVTTAAKSVGGPQPISVLLISSASDDDTTNIKQSFVKLDQESRSRGGRILRGNATPAQIDALSKSDNVLWIEPYRPMKMFDEIASRIVAGDGPPHQTLMQSLGYTGAGVNVAVADSGLDSGDTNSMHPDIQGRVRALFYYDFLTDAADEHSHGTHVAGIVAGNGATGETDANFSFTDSVSRQVRASLLSEFSARTESMRRRQVSKR
jgi:subtilisin family serine protease